MTHPTDVPPASLLPRLAEELKTRKLVEPPVWAAFVKTGVQAQQAPVQPDWWYMRSASVMRKIYLHGVTGVSRLSYDYGGRRDRGSAPYHARTASRAILREIVQQLEHSGLLQPVKARGRRLSPEGRKLIDTLSRETLQKLAAQKPELAKYL
jgi:small subunit ribosomal protein S19e